MSGLFRRELRRLLPFGLIGPLIFLAVLVLQPRSDLLQALAFLAAPAVLGIACVVPDTSSGGTSFFARLPISPGRVLGAKLLAAAVFLLLNTLAGALTIGLTSEPEGGRQLLLGILIPFEVFGFGAGLLASVIASRVMPAILLAPALGAVVFLAGALAPSSLFQIQGGNLLLGLVLFGALGALLVGAACLAYTRGFRHLKTPRPLAIACATLVPALAVWVGGLGAAQAITSAHAVSTLGTVPGVEQAAGVAVVPLQDACWNGVESRVVVLRDGEAWTVPERWVRSPDLSPDGKHLLVSAMWQRGGFLVDLTQDAVRRLPHGRTKAGFGFRHVLWRPDGTPLMVEVRHRTITVFDPLQNELQMSQLPIRASGIAGVTPDQALVVWNADGIYGLRNLVRWPAPPSGAARIRTPDRAAPTGWTVDPQRLGETLQLEPWQDLRGGAINRRSPLVARPRQSEVAQAVLSPTGRYVLVRMQGDTPPQVYDLQHHERAHERVVRLPSLDRRRRSDGPRTRDVGGQEYSEERFGPYVYGFSPGDRMLVVERLNGQGCVVDLERGVTRTFEAARTSNPGFPAVWSADGRRAVLPSGTTVELGDRPLAEVKQVALGRAHPLIAWTPQGGIPLRAPLQLRTKTDAPAAALRWKGGAQ